MVVGRGAQASPEIKECHNVFSADFSLAAAAGCWLTHAAGAEADADVIVSSGQLCPCFWGRCALYGRKPLALAPPLRAAPNANIGISLLISFFVAYMPGN